MSATQPDVLDRSVEKAHIWLNDLAEELDNGGDRREAYRVLRAFLHTLRDRLTIEESAHLAAQLPVLLRGIYYEGWRPSRTPLHYRDPVEFVDRVRVEAGLHGDTEASFAVRAAASVLRRHVSPGEIDGVVRTLPESLRSLIAG